MGEMAGERSRMRFRANGKNHDQYEMKAVDVMTGEVLHRALADTLIRHKWPEEKPEKPAKYLVRVEYDDNGAIVTTDEWSGIDWYEHIEGYITHWWELPKVTE